MNKSTFVGLIRPAIERGDTTLLERVGSYIDEALISRQTSRGVLARAVLDAFPDSRLAELIAEIIQRD
jgi:hypothetical protein